MTTKMTNDGFIWRILTMREAVCAMSAFDLYILHDDDSESLIETIYQFTEAIQMKQTIAIEIGYIDKIR